MRPRGQTPWSHLCQRSRRAGCPMITSSTIIGTSIITISARSIRPRRRRSLPSDGGGLAGVAVDIWEPSESTVDRAAHDASHGTIAAPVDRRSSAAGHEKRPASLPALSSSGGRIRTCDLRVMSPTSYQTAPPRGGFSNVAPARPGVVRGRWLAGGHVLVSICPGHG